MGNSEHFRALYLCDFQISEREKIAFHAAKEYYDRTEAFDKTVCSGTNKHGVSMPTNTRELFLISKNAIAVRKEIMQRHGISAEEFRNGLKALEKSGYA